MALSINSARLSRLRSPKTIPAYVAFGWVALGRLSDIATLADWLQRHSVLNWLLGPWGTLTLLFAGFAWLAYLVLRPEPKPTFGPVGESGRALATLRSLGPRPEIKNRAIAIAGEIRRLAQSYEHPHGLLDAMQRGPNGEYDGTPEAIQVYGRLHYAQVKQLYADAGWATDFHDRGGKSRQFLSALGALTNGPAMPQSLTEMLGIANEIEAKAARTV